MKINESSITPWLSWLSDRESTQEQALYLVRAAILQHEVNEKNKKIKTWSCRTPSGSLMVSIDKENVIIIDSDDRHMTIKEIPYGNNESFTVVSNCCFGRKVK